MDKSIAILITLFCTWGNAAFGQEILTQPTIEVGGGTTQWRGYDSGIGEGNSILSLGVGMWRFAPGNLEWSMSLKYNRLSSSIMGYEGLNLEPAEISWTGQRLHWTTLATYFISKSSFGIQAGGFLGLGLSGTLQDDFYLDEDGTIPLNAITQPRDFSYGPVVGITGGVKPFQVYLRYLWDLKDYLPVAGLELRRSYWNLGVTFVIPGVEIY